MTDQAISILSGSLRQIFRLFTTWNFPGTNVSPAEMFFFLLFVPVALALLSAILGNVFGQYAEDKRADRFREQRARANADRQKGGK